jgi:hypothetical protein
LHKGSLVWDSRESVDWFDEDSFILPNIAGWWWCLASHLTFGVKWTVALSSGSNTSWMVICWLKIGLVLFEFKFFDSLNISSFVTFILLSFLSLSFESSSSLDVLLIYRNVFYSILV